MDTDRLPIQEANLRELWGADPAVDIIESACEIIKEEIDAAIIRSVWRRGFAIGLIVGAVLATLLVLGLS